MPRRTLKVCTVPGCPTLTTTPRCPTHAREADRARGTRQQRGYTTEHDRLRAELAPIVERGDAICWRCRQPIQPGTAWDLGHTDDRSAWTGPEHATCNRAAGGRSAHAG